MDASTTSSSLLPWLPRWFKAVALVILLLNARSTPGWWHVKVWYPALLSHALARIRGPLKHLRLLPNRLADPWTIVSRSSHWAALDDVDYNRHLSNSCYAKNLDAARMKACCDFFSPFFTAGGWAALGGAHYDFVKQIDAFDNYEIEVTIGGVGDKWVYLVGTFITRPSGKSKGLKSKAVDSGFSSPAAGPSTSSPAKAVRADGAIVHCVSVSTYCFKVGRLTIPPAVVLAFCGFGKALYWERFEHLYSPNPKAMRAWLKEGWKEEEAQIREEFEKPGKVMGAKGEQMRASLAGFNAAA